MSDGRPQKIAFTDMRDIRVRVDSRCSPFV